MSSDSDTGSLTHEFDCVECGKPFEFRPDEVDVNHEENLNGKIVECDVCGEGYELLRPSHDEVEVWNAGGIVDTFERLRVYECRRCDDTKAFTDVDDYTDHVEAYHYDEVMEEAEPL